MSDIRSLKTLTCPTVTGKTKLTYAIGVDEEGAIYLAIRSNAGGGFFSPEWIALSAILESVEDQAEAFTSYPLFSLFRGKSVNTPGFMMAVLKHEKLAIPLKGRNRKYALGNPDTFRNKVEKLQAVKKPSTKKKVTRRRKPGA